MKLKEHKTVANPIKNGDKQKAELLWREYEPYIRKLCEYKLSSMPSYVDDCVQDVFAALIETLHRGIIIEEPKKWLTTVAVNKISRIYKAIYSEESIISLDDYSASKSLLSDSYKDRLDIVLTEQRMEEIENIIIGMLDDGERSLLIEHYKKKIDVITLSKNYCTTTNNIYKRLFRLRLKVQKLVRDFVESDDL